MMAGCLGLQPWAAIAASGIRPTCLRYRRHRRTVCRRLRNPLMLVFAVRYRPQISIILPIPSHYARRCRHWLAHWLMIRLPRLPVICCPISSLYLLAFCRPKATWLMPAPFLSSAVGCRGRRGGVGLFSCGLTAAFFFCRFRRSLLLPPRRFSRPAAFFLASSYLFFSFVPARFSFWLVSARFLFGGLFLAAFSCWLHRLFCLGGFLGSFEPSGSASFVPPLAVAATVAEAAARVSAARSSFELFDFSNI